MHESDFRNPLAFRAFLDTLMPIVGVPKASQSRARRPHGCDWDWAGQDRGKPSSR